MPFGDRRELLLHLVQAPRGGEAAGVLARVGVPDHALLHPADVVPVPLRRQQRLHDLRRPGQVVQRFEQGGHGEGVPDAALALKQDDGQHVGRGVGHGDDVVPQRVAGEAGQLAKRAQHVVHLGGGGQGGGEQGALAGQLAQQEARPLLLAPRRVRAQAQVGGHRVQGFRVLD